MKIYLGTDHRGFELKERIKSWLEEWKIEYEDLGNKAYDKKDDYVDFAKKVGVAVGLDSKTRGIVICGSGAGVNVAVNKIDGVRGVLGFNKRQVKHGVERDKINVLGLASDYLSGIKAKRLVKSFLNSEFKMKKRDVRRIKKISKLEV